MVLLHQHQEHLLLVALVEMLEDIQIKYQDREELEVQDLTQQLFLQLQEIHMEVEGVEEQYLQEPMAQIQQLVLVEMGQVIVKLVLQLIMLEEEEEVLWTTWILAFVPVLLLKPLPKRQRI